MTLHLIKLSVGAENADDMAVWVKKRVAINEKRGWGAVHDHVTRMFPQRDTELLDGGSLYWVIKGMAQLRQTLAGFRPVIGEDGIERCAILLSPNLVTVQPQPKRAFQGWRYLKPEDAPRDVNSVGKSRRGDIALRAHLAELGLL